MWLLWSATLLPLWISLRGARASAVGHSVLATAVPPAGKEIRQLGTEQGGGGDLAGLNTSAADSSVSCAGRHGDRGVCWDRVMGNFSLRAPELRAEWQSTGGFSQALGAIPDGHVRQMREEALRGFSASHRKGIVAPSKSQSQGYDYVKQFMPTAMSLYKDPVFIKSLEQISGRKKLMLSADSDPHAAVVYYYAQAGDFIGWHYDTSFYYGERLTVLVPLFDNSTCELQVELMARDLDLERQEKEDEKEVTFLAWFFQQFGQPVKTGVRVEDIDFSSPAHECRSVQPGGQLGQIVFFDGDSVRHRVTALGKGELRVMLSMEYVTTQDANPIYWLIYMFGQWGGYFGFPMYVKVMCYLIVLAVGTLALRVGEVWTGCSVNWAAAAALVTASFAYFTTLL